LVDEFFAGLFYLIDNSST